MQRIGTDDFILNAFFQLEGSLCNLHEHETVFNLLQDALYWPKLELTVSMKII